MEQRKLTAEELKLMAFYHQLIALGRDTEVAARLIILRPDGTRFAGVSLSDRDLDAVTDRLASLNETKKALDAEEAALGVEDSFDRHSAEALAIVRDVPEKLAEPTQSDVDEVMAGFESLLRGEGGQTA
mgnify:FL=1